MTNKVPILATCAAVLCLPLLGAYIANAEANTPASADGFMDNIGYTVAVALVAPVVLTGLLTGGGLALRSRAPRSGFGLVVAGLAVARLAVLTVGWVETEGGGEPSASRPETTVAGWRADGRMRPPTALVIAERTPQLRFADPVVFSGAHKRLDAPSSPPLRSATRGHGVSD